MTIALISAVYGGYDNLKHPVPQEGDVRCICITDNPDLESDVWEMVYWPKPHMSPFLAAKSPKMLPMRHVDADTSVWIDMSVQVHSPTFAVECAAYAKDGIATWPHPWNATLEAEVAESSRQARYQGQRLNDQMLHYWEQGMPLELPVRHTAVVARAHNDLTERAGLEWDYWYEWSMADQVGFMFATWSTGVPMYELPLDQAFLMGFTTPHRGDAWISHHFHVQTGVYK